MKTSYFRALLETKEKWLTKLKILKNEKHTQ